MAFSKNLTKKKMQIFFLKFLILRSFIETSFKQFIVNFSNRNLIILGSFLLPLAIYFNFVQSSKYTKWISVLEKNLPGTVLGSNTISWETFQKTNFIHKFTSFRESSMSPSIPILEKQLNPLLFQNSIQSLDYWSDFLTIEFTKTWKSYQKQYFLGFKPNQVNFGPGSDISTINNNNSQEKSIHRPLVFVGRENIKSRFYAVNIDQSSTSSIQKNDYELDEFPLKLENSQIPKTLSNSQLDISGNQNESIISTKQQNKRFVGFTFTDMFFEKYIDTIPRSSDKQSQNHLPLNFVGIQNTKKPQPKELFNPLSGQTGNQFQTNQNIQTQLNEIERQFKQLFYSYGYLVGDSDLFKKADLLVEKSKAVSKLVGQKYASIASSQIFQLLDSIPIDTPQISPLVELSEFGLETQIGGNSLQGDSSIGVDQFVIDVQTRKMSGFSYPDMTIDQLLTFQRQNSYFQKFPLFRLFLETDVSERVAVFLGSHFSYPTNAFASKPEPLTLRCKYYPAKFEGIDKPISYLGPVVISKNDLNLLNANSDARFDQTTLTTSLSESALELSDQTTPTQTTALLELSESELELSEPELELRGSEESLSITPTTFEAYNWVKVHQNLQAFFDKDDPRLTNQVQFFGYRFFDSFAHYETNANSGSSSSRFFIAQNEEDQLSKQLIKRKDLSAERENLLQVVKYCSEDFVIPYFAPHEWQNWLNSPDTNPNRQPYSKYLPIRQVSAINGNTIENSFDSMDYQNPTTFIESLVPRNFINLTFHTRESPFTEFGMAPNLARNHYVLITYLKRMNFYESSFDFVPNSFGFKKLYESIQLTNTPKREIWEPIHANSWLVISQYAFAIFVLYLLRQLTVSYGRELIAYLIDLFSSLGIFDASFKDELMSDDSRYRIIEKPTVRFKNVAGIDQVFAQLSEIVWFLRKSKRYELIATPDSLPKGILLVGPPGTGKTLLVQAIAGEAEVPIFLQPAGVFSDTENLGAQRLQQLFEKARQVAPCLIFFDEIDSIGQRRSHIIENPANSDSLFDLVAQSNTGNTAQTKEAKCFGNSAIAILDEKGPASLNKNKSEVHNNVGKQSWDWNSGQDGNASTENQKTSDQLSLLMQLLIELDGLQSSRKIIVIGATNRADVLDPALIRPGRFDKVLQLGLPKKLKRMQICQLYANILGTQSQIYWDYIGNKTFGLSGADLATIMNQSAIEAILNGTKHTMQTIELAINKVIGDNTESYLTHHEPLIPRLAYYFTGSAVAKLFLPQLKTPIACSLFPRRGNTRYTKVANTFLLAQMQISQRQELKAQIGALYAGKVCELLYFKTGLKTPNSFFFHANFGSDDLAKATNLIYQVVDQWHLYSHHFLIEKFLDFYPTKNTSEILDTQTMNFLDSLASEQNQENPYFKNTLEFMKYYNFQSWYGKSWWQIQVTEEESSPSPVYGNWYRIYLKNPSETYENDEWVLPDQYYHMNNTHFLTKTVYGTSLLKNKRDLLYQVILHKVIEETFELFYESGEFIDFFVTFLIKNQYLRRFEMDHLYSQFYQV